MQDYIEQGPDDHDEKHNGESPKVLTEANRKQLIKILTISMYSAIAVFTSCILKDRIQRGWGWDVIIWHCYTGVSFCILSLFFKHCISKGVGGSLALRVVPIIHISYLMFCCVESGFFDFPSHYQLTPYMLTFIAVEDYYYVALDMPLRTKNIHRSLLWGYYIGRCYLYISGHTSVIHQSYINSIRNSHKELQSMFKNTLDVVPNGVLIIDIKKHTIEYANKEMHLIFDCECTSDNIVLQNQVKKFLLVDSSPSAIETPKPSQMSPHIQRRKGSSIAYRQQQSSSSKRSSLESTQSMSGLYLSKKNLWDSMVDMLDHSSDKNSKEQVFKAKEPKRYIQVKTSFINNGTQILAICTDITRIKEMEAAGRRMRSSFFSSVAHELRTPLNSIIPIVKMVLDILKDREELARVYKFINIVHNSSIHLQNVIEDALDISRLENNQFQIFMESFEVRKIVEEVSQLMDFQIERKGLRLNVTISEKVPARITCDAKRFKQVLFNLIGNAIKFTFKGSINVNLDFDDDACMLIGSVQDTGVGIKQSDLDQLFKFFGTLAKSKDINRGGMGLGLTISKMIIQSLGGDIGVESEVGKGSSFTFSVQVKSFEREQQLEKLVQQQNIESLLNEELSLTRLESARSRSLERNNQLYTDLCSDYQPSLGRAASPLQRNISLKDQDKESGGVVPSRTCSQLYKSLPMQIVKMGHSSQEREAECSI
ncbi:hypothetical protein FGO68_gene5913 [Halteria grandinella]|uniref:histidine kinase n=1 Tax=Halteria grandinella TaxID=5974 RepID=A0A8J8NYI7_HALGN|nr:hypothetical protein FGO68_gene5913 [Halteria grandinella]